MAPLAPYAEQHKDPQGPGDIRPTAFQIIEDQGLVSSPEWAGRVVLITGCSPGGLGPETAKAIYRTGADVYMTVRDLEKGKQVADEVLAEIGNGKVEVIQMDLGSLASIRGAAEEFLRKSGNKLNILINNAGIMACPKGKTTDGFELQLGTNHLGHFYLFHVLKDALLASASSSFNSRLISVSSAAHRRTPMHFDDLQFERTEYDPLISYGQSKLANLLFANEVDRRYKSQNLRALSLHPGGIITPLARYITNLKDQQGDPMIAKILKNPAQGASTTVWAAVAKELGGKGGIYLEEVAESELAPPDKPYFLGGYSPEAYDPVSEERLWNESLRLTGLTA